MSQAIALDKAAMCVNCDTITDAAPCPACGSHGLWLIEKWLGRAGLLAPASQQPQAGAEDEESNAPTPSIMPANAGKVEA